MMGGTSCGGGGAVKPAAAGGEGPQGQALRRLVRHGESEPTDKPVWRRFGTDPASADFEYVADLPLPAWRGLATRFCAVDLPLADILEDGPRAFVLADAGLRNRPQVV